MDTEVLELYIEYLNKLIVLIRSVLTDSYNCSLLSKLETLNTVVKELDMFKGIDKESGITILKDYLK